MNNAETINVRKNPTETISQRVERTKADIVKLKRELEDLIHCKNSKAMDQQKKSQLKTEKSPVADKEIKKQRLEELQRTSRELVRKNLEKKRERSKSRNRDNEVRIDRAEVKTNRLKQSPNPTCSKTHDHTGPDYSKITIRGHVENEIGAVKRSSRANLPKNISKSQQNVAKVSTVKSPRSVSQERAANKPTNTHKLESDPSVKPATKSQTVQSEYSRINHTHSNPVLEKIANIEKTLPEPVPALSLKQTKETQTIPTMTLREPPWLSNPNPNPDRYNFINTVRHKLQYTVKSVDVAVQKTPISLRNLDAHRVEALQLVSNKPHSDGESDTSKNVPELSTESLDATPLECLKIDRAITYSSTFETRSKRCEEVNPNAVNITLRSSHVEERKFQAEESLLDDFHRTVNNFNALEQSYMEVSLKSREYQNLEPSFSSDISAFLNTTTNIQDDTTVCDNDETFSNNMLVLPDVNEGGNVIGGTYCAGLSLNMLDHLIRDEDSRIKHLKTIINISEHNIRQRTKTELRCLEIHRRQLLDNGKIEAASTIRKKQRGIIVKHELERNEVRKMQQSENARCSKRKESWRKQRNFLKNQLMEGKLAAIATKSTTVQHTYHYQQQFLRERAASPMRVMPQRPNDMELSLFQDGNEGADGGRSGADTFLEARRALSLRESVLQERKRTVEQLLRWHSHLAAEERKVTEMECAAKSLIDRAIDTTSHGDGGHADGNRSATSQRRHLASERDERYSSTFDAESSISDLMQNLSRIEDTVHSLARMSDSIVMETGASGGQLRRAASDNCIDARQSSILEYKLSRRHSEAGSLTTGSLELLTSKRQTDSQTESHKAAESLSTGSRKSATSKKLCETESKSQTVASQILTGSLEFATSKKHTETDAEIETKSESLSSQSEAETLRTESLVTSKKHTEPETSQKNASSLRTDSFDEMTSRKQSGSVEQSVSSTQLGTELKTDQSVIEIQSKISENPPATDSNSNTNYDTKSNVENQSVEAVPESSVESSKKISESVNLSTSKQQSENLDSSSESNRTSSTVEEIQRSTTPETSSEIKSATEDVSTGTNECVSTTKDFVESKSTEVSMHLHGQETETNSDTSVIELNSPEEGSDSGTEEVEDRTVVTTGSGISNSNGDVSHQSNLGSEAEQLLRKQLAIEQEIKQLEQQQQQQQQRGHVPYLYMREIPNKPPPPYTPPAGLPLVPKTPVPSDVRAINVITCYSSKILHKAHVNSNFAKVKYSDTSFRLYSNNCDVADTCAEFMFNICKELAWNVYREFAEPPQPSWLTFVKHPNRRESNVRKPMDAVQLERFLNGRLRELFGFKKCRLPDNAILRWSSKRRDNVDELLVIESQQAEAEWTSVQKEEALVKDQIANFLMDELIRDTTKVFQRILAKRIKSS